MIAHGLVDRDSEDLNAFVDSREDFRSVASRVRAAFQGANYEISDNDSLGDPGRILTWYVRPRKTSTPWPSVPAGEDPAPARPDPPRPGPRAVWADDHPVELGAQKLTVIYEDARPRDYDDLARIATHYRLDRIIEVADERHFQPLDRPTIALTMRQVACMRAADIPERCGLPSLIAYFDSVAGLITHGASGHASSVPTPYSPEWLVAGTSRREQPAGGPTPDTAAVQRYLLEQSQPRLTPSPDPARPRPTDHRVSHKACQVTRRRVDCRQTGSVRETVQAAVLVSGSVRHPWVLERA